LKNYLILLFTLFPIISVACPICMTTIGMQVRDGIFDPYFWFNLFLVTLPFITLILIGVALSYSLSLTSYKNSQPLLAAGFVLGMGLGGFFDGIVFHQILQIHNMISNIIFPDTLIKAEINMFWDGVFHAFNWMIVVIGIVLLWKVVKNDGILKRTNVFVGALLSGAGAFNLVEGIVDHHVLQLHHVVQRAVIPYQFYYDVLFLCSGIVLIGLGCGLIFYHKDKKVA
jgi:uncharacterized membrane protein